MKSWWGILWPISLGLMLGLLASGLILLVSSQPRGEAVRLSPPPTAPPLVVHVSGAVSQPGVFNLMQGSRVQDAIQAAGGITPDADAQALNLAAPLADGVLVYVPLKSQEGPATMSPGISAPSPAGNPGPTAGGLININTASQSELESLPGIGPVLAQRIIEYRQSHGAFSSTEAIIDVSGIGPGIFEKIKDLITVN